LDAASRRSTAMMSVAARTSSAERRLAASNERIGVAISDYYPKVSLSGALGFDSINGGTFF